MEKVRFGIIGCGNMGTSHARRLAAGEIENGVLSACCDTAPDKLEKMKEVYGDTIQYFATAEEMLKAKACDVVMICTPHYDHPPLAILAMDYHTHCIVEKPAGVYTLQVKEMLEREKQQKEKIKTI